MLFKSEPYCIDRLDCDDTSVAKAVATLQSWADNRVQNSGDIPDGVKYYSEVVYEPTGEVRSTFDGRPADKTVVAAQQFLAQQFRDKIHAATPRTIGAVSINIEHSIDKRRPQTDNFHIDRPFAICILGKNTRRFCCVQMDFELTDTELAPMIGDIYGGLSSFSGDTVVNKITLEAIKNCRAKVLVPDYGEITSCLGRTDIHCRGSEPDGAGWRIKIRTV